MCTSSWEEEACLVPSGPRALLQAGTPRGARIVDQHMHFVRVLGDLRSERAAAGLGPKVRRDRDARPGTLRRQREGRLSASGLVPRRNDDACTVGNEALGHHGADAASPARDDDGFAGHGEKGGGVQRGHLRRHSDVERQHTEKVGTEERVQCVSGVWGGWQGGGDLGSPNDPPIGGQKEEGVHIQAFVGAVLKLVVANRCVAICMRYLINTHNFRQFATRTVLCLSFAFSSSPCLFFGRENSRFSNLHFTSGVGLGTHRHYQLGGFNCKIQ